MTAEITEWEFTAEVASWLNGILHKNPDLPFASAKCEQRGKGSNLRRDLTLFDKNQKVVLTGEVKLPYRNDGGSPYNETVVQDARKKAKQAHSPYFFTWNVNEFVLWKTFLVNTSPFERQYRVWPVTQVHKPSHMDVPSTGDSIRKWLAQFLVDFQAILYEQTPIGIQSLDEKFIDALESSLNLPVLLLREELEERYKKPHIKNDLDRWMRDEQGWIITDDPDGIRDNLERAAKSACYALLIRLVFYEALLKRYRSKMEKLSVPGYLDTGEELRLHLAKCFADAKDVTEDYETVFGADHTSIGNRIPFYTDKAVPHWRELINQIHCFDFSQLDYEVIGSIFERLLTPEERHKFGQFYTRVEVVDLINSFCIRKGDEKIMDPACGGGTFLVRAYARKRELNPRCGHRKLLGELYGIDITDLATRLTTINLATRDLVEEENYPRIARKDFFDMKRHETFLSLPKHIKTKGLGKTQHLSVEIPPLDAVVGNPPYLRQEDIRRSRKGTGSPEPGTKEYYLRIVQEESGAQLSGRSDIHCYFWPHATHFLKEDGYLCFLTSSQWLDVEYGFRLQEWILRNFELIAVLESLCEPWFVGARVATAVTILRRQKDMDARMNNLVRFVQLRQPLKEILAHDGTSTGMFLVTNAFRDEILSLKTNTVTPQYRARLIRQGDLWNQGVELGRMMGKSKDSDESGDYTGGYYGGKWGLYLRAPDLWFELLDEYGDRFVPLGEIAEIWRGITSGKDVFFFPKDASQDCLLKFPDKKEFLEAYGLPRSEVQSGKVKLVRCGEGRGEVRPIEAKYLEPEVHSLMEVNGFTVAPENCSRQILLVGKSRAHIKDKYVLRYLEWGELKKYHTGSTCAARVSSKREWYDLTGHKRGKLFWPMAQQYKHVVPINNQNLICNHNLFDLTEKNINQNLLVSILNSSWMILSKYQFGRPVGVEGNLKTEIVDVNMMLVPDPRKAEKKQAERVVNAFEKMKQRPVFQFLSERRLRRMAYQQAGKEEELETLSDQCELDMPDRRELDDAVLEMLGETSPQRRDEILDRLYCYLREFFESTRQKEEIAIRNKNVAKRQGRMTPKELAAQIYQEIMDLEPEWLRRYDPDFIDLSKPYDTIEITPDGEARILEDLLSQNGVSFVKKKKVLQVVETKIPEQVSLIVLIANSGVRGLVRIPHEPEECTRIEAEYEMFIYHRRRRIQELISRRTNDEDLQKKILDALEPLLHHH